MSRSKQTLTACLMAVSALTLSACGEKAQEMAGQPKQDAAPYTGTGVAAFTSGDWKAGDKNSWVQKLKARAQYGMNDHSRSN
jgi:ABC-type oligopeptide transport system substrate-binding subunit